MSAPASIFSSDADIHHALNVLSPLDGRYAESTEALRNYLSEAALMRYRVMVEVHWLIALSGAGLAGLPRLSASAESFLLQLVERFTLHDAARIKAIEQRTRHDVKAVEYWLKASIKEQHELSPAGEFIHFACTSEDLNNTAYALMLKDARAHVLLPALNALGRQLLSWAHTFAAQPMLSRTHGQPASPTTLGKEMANIAARLHLAIEHFAAVSLRGKMNGAVGNYNAHISAYPEVDWPAFSRAVVEDRLGLDFNPYTTQIEPHDGLAELFDALVRINTIILDLNRDLWGYISLGYFTQKTRSEEVGSSTMPHKVNPIDFENSEGNLGLANAFLRHFSDKLPVSRWQRDLSDSTVLRNIGVAFGHALLAYQSCLRGLNRLEINPKRMAADLDGCWEVVAEAVQTVMRRYGVPNPYEQLKALTRGQNMTRATLHAFIQAQPLPSDAKESLLALTPASYIGNAAELAAHARFTFHPEEEGAS
jgi:adenylosuccinate lyase